MIYSSHLPVLVFIPRAFTIQHVVELGTGAASTPTFLRKNIYTDLKSLTSYENAPGNPSLAKVASIEDPRFNLVMVEGAMANVSLNLSSTDMLFIDDSVSVEDRVATIKMVIATRYDGLIVLHDYNNVAYQRAMVHRPKAVVRYSNLPHTAVFWSNKKYDGLLDKLPEIQKVVDKYDPTAKSYIWKRRFDAAGS